MQRNGMLRDLEFTCKKLRNDDVILAPDQFQQCQVIGAGDNYINVMLQVGILLDIVHDPLKSWASVEASVVVAPRYHCIECIVSARRAT